MKYAKLIDGYIQYAPKKIKRGETIVYNPTAQMLILLGYKPVTENPMPVCEEGYHCEPFYRETTEEIIIDWNIVEDYVDELTELKKRIEEQEDALVELAELIGG